MIFWFFPNMLSFVYTAINCLFIIKLVRGIPRNYWTAIKRHGILTLPIEIRVILYLVVFFISWPLDIITNAMGYAPEFRKCQIFSLLIVYQFLLQFQGAMDAMVFGITNKQLRTHYQERPFRAVIVFLFGPILVIPFFIGYVVRKTRTTKRELVEEKKPILDGSVSSLSSSESVPQLPKEMYRKADIKYSNNAF